MRGLKLRLGTEMVMLMSLAIWLALHSVTGQIDFKSERENHPLRQLSANKRKRVAKLSNNSLFRNQLVSPLLIERVSDTDGNRQAQQHIKQWLSGLGWHIGEDSFQDSTPLGPKQFTNIIATFDPSAKRFLVLACHFDSKRFTEFTFIGATDAAVPCAMILDIARSLNSKLNNTDSVADGVSLQLLFFDGEEAFLRWTSRDSLYGSRHLAEKWENTAHPLDPSSTLLEGMDMLVLLDLIGHRNPIFHNFFPSKTGRFFDRLNTIESQLHQMRQLRGHSPNEYFGQSSRRGGIEDDHVPFMKLGVPILHLISAPFPDVWHTENDNGSAIHYRTVNHLNKILRVFVAEYLHLLI